MGIISSVLKSSKIKKLQRKIAPKDGATAADVLAVFMDPSRRRKHEEALKLYLDLCESDDNVAFVMDQYDLNRSDLDTFFNDLAASGLAGWTKGHYVPLSSIAYGEPLIFLASVYKNETYSKADAAYQLTLYWNCDIPNGGLIQLLKEGS